tara:strand:+ start:4538 stop:5683 length:1146 start_codon:yes stop_codon:yes gene_type:complete
MSHVQTNIAELDQMARTALASKYRKPFALIGMVGIAKTQWIKNRYRELYAEHLGLATDKVGFIQTRVANRDAAEIAGVALPIKNDDGTVGTQFTKPPLVAELWAAHDAGFTHGINLIDEFGQAGTDVQKVFADMFDPDERTLAGWAIPDGWIIAWTGNRTADKSGANRILSHIMGRCRVFELEFDIKSWADWAANNGVNPLAIDCAMAYADEGFFAESVPTEDGPFCTPRSLTHAAADLTAFTDSSEFDGASLPSYMEKLIASSIGAKSAVMLRKYIDEADQVPTADEIFADPTGANVPDGTGHQLLAANRAINCASDADTGEAALAYITRLRPDLQVSLGSKLLRTSARNGWVLTSSVAVAFIQKFHDLLPLAQTAGMEV